MDLVSENIVVTANRFNPTILSQLWLKNNGIVNEGEFLDGCIFTPLLVQVQSTNFELFAVEERFQVAIHPQAPDKAKIVESVVGRIVELLPQTPYTALGLNFIWNFVPQTPLREAGRKYFSNQESAVFREFDDDSAKYGGYYSKDALGFRLQLSALPVIEPPSENAPAGRSLFQFQFNFHADVKETPEIKPLLANWSKASKIAQDIMGAVEKSV